MSYALLKIVVIIGCKVTQSTISFSYSIIARKLSSKHWRKNLPYLRNLELYLLPTLLNHSILLFGSSSQNLRQCATPDICSFRLSRRGSKADLDSHGYQNHCRVLGHLRLCSQLWPHWGFQRCECGTRPIQGLDASNVGTTGQRIQWTRVCHRGFLNSRYQPPVPKSYSNQDLKA